MSTSGRIETLYRTFLKQPFATSALKEGGKKRKGRGVKRGGKITRFGSTLSGTPNPNFLFGCPTGGAEGILTPNIRGPEFLGGKRKKHYRGSGSLMNDFINPSLGFYNTFPQIGSTIY